MSFGNITDLNALTALQGGKSVGVAAKKGASGAQLQAAFETQMRMTQNLFGEGSRSSGEGSSLSDFDTSFVNDAMMMEALTTITGLMRQEAGIAAPVQQKATTAIKPEAVQVPVRPMPEVGALSAKFESGSAGVAAIGYDRVGGTSYGKYQIASKPGTMDRFLSYLDKNAPAWADRLRNAGPANTGTKEGGMPSVWKEIAAENPTRFEKMQHDFIAGETYIPARDMIFKQTGLDFDNAPPALREVLWSTSVQHGPTGASKIFGKVINQFVGKTGEVNFNTKLIEGVYDTRKGQFGSSTKRVQQSVANRLNEEKQIALNMLGKMQINRIV
ncbi:hypothetical protein [uncultured Pseudodesulfovibrio sp.]|uniref:VgrG-related protein n=1 Tax=uncultured Pseudodesulfovibrio sp. TaxID=2035858 RepID=UPI0029C7E08E|nr:hypothetical protein [uncultured Pseudodesulfovibrio sp.]